MRIFNLFSTMAVMQLLLLCDATTPVQPPSVKQQQQQQQQQQPQSSQARFPQAVQHCDAGTRSPLTGRIFGVSQTTAASTTASTSTTLQQLRGGAVQEPETLEDVDAILLKAASEGKLVIIDFTATWCGPCKMISPVFQELSEIVDAAVFVKVDVDENPDTAAKYNVSAMPTFVFIKSGEVVDRLMGANPARLEELIQEHL